LCRERIEKDAQIPAEQKAAMLPSLKQQENRCFAFNAGVRMAERLRAAKQQGIALTLWPTNAENLALFRERVA
jgi:hypothetical protein